MRGAKITDPLFVGASLLAMDVNDDACSLDERVIVNVHREQSSVDRLLLQIIYRDIS